MACNPRHNQCGKQPGKLIGTLSHDAPLLRCSFYNPDGQGSRTGFDHRFSHAANCTGTV
ncbi:Uncharacterized protein AC511_3080 [Pseudomonas coronafaciens pv. oryzae]|nr:Uncharacterized protein AC511_3080 [Pseudomonas coronafaciens pv. oryzae]